jgi:hypothetical protein
MNIAGGLLVVDVGCFFFLGELQLFEGVSGDNEARPEPTNLCCYYSQGK